MLKRMLSLSLLLLALSASSHAATLQVTVTGTVAGGSDEYGSVLGLGPNGDPTGQAVTIVFLIDTAKAPADGFASASIGDYRVERASARRSPRLTRT